MAVVISAAMMIPASADNTNPPIEMFTTSISGDINSNLNTNTYYQLRYNDNAYLGFCIDQQLEKNYTYVFNITVGFDIQIPNAIMTDNFVYIQSNPNKITSFLETQGNLEDYITPIRSEIDQETVQYTMIFNTNNIPDALLNRYLYLIIKSRMSSPSDQVTFIYFSLDCECIYDPNQTEFDKIMEKLDEISDNQTESNNIINEVLQQIIINNNNWQTIINYGSNYNQIDQTLINNLGSTEDQLSSAEDALQNKSKSLVQRASGGVQQAVTASGQLVSSLTSTVPTVVSFATDIIDQTPDEVQAAVLAVPLLSFAAWLIGLKK